MVGYRCITQNELYRSITDVPFYICRHICAKSGDCSITNYNTVDNLCLISNDTCLFLQKDTDYQMNYISIRKRDSCIEWVSNFNFARAIPVISETCNQYGSERPCYVGRHVSSSHILPGKYHRRNLYAENLWTVFNGPMGVTEAMEILDVQPDCQVTWMPFTAGDPVPFNAVVGGYMEGGDSMLYVIRAEVEHFGNMFTVFGYYFPEAERGYVEYVGVHVLTVMDMLILIWYINNWGFVLICCWAMFSEWKWLINNSADSGSYQKAVVWGLFDCIIICKCGLK